MKYFLFLVLVFGLCVAMLSGMTIKNEEADEADEEEDDNEKRVASSGKGLPSETNEESAAGEAQENPSDAKTSEENPSEEKTSGEENPKEENPTEEKEGKQQTEEKEVNAQNNASCNLKIERVGCYKKKSPRVETFTSSLKLTDKISVKKGKIQSAKNFNEMLPKVACECANAALKAGNAVFSLRNIAECWTGPDDTKYDAEGPSDQCVSFDEKTCQKSDKMCAGKKHADFVYYIDTPEHTKPAEEVAEELKAAAELLKKQAKKQAKHSKAKAKKGKTGKGKKSKKSKKHAH